LVKTGRIEKYLVDPPNPTRKRNASVLGAILIAVGLILLTLVLLGFWQEVLFG
jgi:hypothetical protein